MLEERGPLKNYGGTETASPSPLNLSRRGSRESARGRTERNKKKRKAEEIRKRSEYYFSKDEGGYLWQRRRRKWQRSWKIEGGKRGGGPTKRKRGKFLLSPPPAFKSLLRPSPLPKAVASWGVPPPPLLSPA